MKKFKAVMVLMLATSSSYAAKSEHVLWEKIPIRVELPIGEERMIHFPSPISIVDSELDEQIGIMKMADALYLNPDKAFKNKRLIVQLMPEGEAIVLSLSAHENNHNATPLEIVLPKEEGEKDDKAVNQNLAANEGASGPNEEGASGSLINPVSLTRFAIQSLYAPARLLVTPPGVSRTPMETQKNVMLVYGASVSAHPLISWTADNLYVTAVELKNDLNKKVVLDPRNLLGEWQTATFFPTNTLSPRSSHETTTVFLVSARPFKEALLATSEYVR